MVAITVLAAIAHAVRLPYRILFVLGVDQSATFAPGTSRQSD